MGGYEGTARPEAAAGRLESVPVACCDLDAEASIEDVNAQAAALLGTARERLLGRPLVEVAPLRDPPAFMRHFRDCLDSKVPVSVRLELDSATGERTVLLSSVHRESPGPVHGARTALVLLSAGGEPRGPDGPEVDWLESVLESMPQAVLYADERGRVRANQAARALALVGAPGAGQRVTFRARTREGHEVPWERSPLMRALLSGETITSEELVLDAPDGRALSVLACATPLGGATRRRGAVAVFQDVTTLRTVVRMREKWISVIAHELRQPLGTMLISLGALGRAQELARPCPEAVTRMRTAVGRLDRMIDDLLDKARIDTRKIKIALETVDLARLAGEIVARASHLLLDCPVTIERIGDQPLAVAADPDRIEQILLNLLSNAAKYGSPRGEIGLRLEAKGPDVVVAVRNGGGGLTAEECRRVFDREYRTASSEAGDRSGLGLGLYIAKGLVEAQGGRIWVESLPGTATTFSFALPRHVARIRGTG